jgi:hypothetical protein
MLSSLTNCTTSSIDSDARDAVNIDFSLTFQPHSSTTYTLRAIHFPYIKPRGSTVRSSVFQSQLSVMLFHDEEETPIPLLSADHLIPLVRAVQAYTKDVANRLYGDQDDTLPTTNSECFEDRRREDDQTTAPTDDEVLDHTDNTTNDEIEECSSSYSDCIRSESVEQSVSLDEPVYSADDADVTSLRFSYDFQLYRSELNDLLQDLLINTESLNEKLEARLDAALAHVRQLHHDFLARSIIDPENDQVVSVTSSLPTPPSSPSPVSIASLYRDNVRLRRSLLAAIRYMLQELVLLVGRMS